MAFEVEDYAPVGLLRRRRAQAWKLWAISSSLVLGWLLVIVGAPLAAAAGWTAVSDPVYHFFSFLCHQMPERSLHLESHQFAVCSRCFGVYFGLAAGFLLYPLFRAVDEIEPLPRMWLFASLVPIGIDWSLGVFGIWENTHLSRFSTGALLGVACAVFILPGIVELGRYFTRKD